MGFVSFYEINTILLLLLLPPMSCFVQFTSSHLSTNTSSSGLGASVQSIPDYVYTQLSNPQFTSPEAKKLHQDIFTVSQRGVSTGLIETHRPECLTVMSQNSS